MAEESDGSEMGGFCLVVGGGNHLLFEEGGGEEGALLSELYVQFFFKLGIIQPFPIHHYTLPSLSIMT